MNANLCQLISKFVHLALALLLHLFMPDDVIEIRCHLDLCYIIVNICGIQLKFTKHLKGSCWLCPE